MFYSFPCNYKTMEVMDSRAHGRALCLLSLSLMSSAEGVSGMEKSPRVKHFTATRVLPNVELGFYWAA